MPQKSQTTTGGAVSKKGLMGIEGLQRGVQIFVPPGNFVRNGKIEAGSSAAQYLESLGYRLV
jgi:hypothetical protein